MADEKADAATSAAYPDDLDAIPAAGEASSSNPSVSRTRSSPSRRGSLLTVPRSVRALFARFPLHIYPEAEVVGPSLLGPPEQLTLYVAPPHPPRKAEASPGWASAEPTCLRWQMDMLWRGVDVQCIHIEREDSWGPSGGTLPYLHLPPALQPIAPPYSPLVGASALPRWVENYAPYGYEAPELREGRQHNESGSGSQQEAGPYKDLATKLEAKTWETLLERRVLAGVSLQYLRIHRLRQAARSARGGLLAQLVFSSRAAAHDASHRRSLSALSPAVSPTASIPPWGLLSWTGAAGSWLSGGSSALPGGEEGDDLPEGWWTDLQSAGLDTNKLLADAVDGLDAIGRRMQSSTSPPAKHTWFLGAKAPTSLDALLFAILHTLLSLPLAPTSAELALRRTVEKHPALGDWARHVYTEYVLPHGG